MTARTSFVLGMHHVAVVCSDYERSKRFYTEVLGLGVVSEVYGEARRSHKLDLRLPDGTQVELFSFPDPPPRPSYPEGCGLRHLAFAVVDLDAAVAFLRKHGIAVESVRMDEYTGRRLTLFAAPDGLPSVPEFVRDQFAIDFQPDEEEEHRHQHVADEEVANSPPSLNPPISRPTGVCQNFWYAGAAGILRVTVEKADHVGRGPEVGGRPKDKGKLSRMRRAERLLLRLSASQPDPLGIHPAGLVHSPRGSR